MLLQFETQNETTKKCLYCDRLIWESSFLHRNECLENKLFSSIQFGNCIAKVLSLSRKDDGHKENIFLK